MPFANPAQPIDYALIGSLVDASIDYGLVRNADELALASTDANLAALQTDVDTLQTVLSAVSADLSKLPARPEVAGWTNARKTALAQLLMFQLALDAAHAVIAQTSDGSPAAAAVVADLEAATAATWDDVK